MTASNLIQTGPFVVHQHEIIGARQVFNDALPENFLRNIFSVKNLNLGSVCLEQPTKLPETHTAKENFFLLTDGYRGIGKPIVLGPGRVRGNGVHNRHAARYAAIARVLLALKLGKKCIVIGLGDALSQNL